MSSLDTEEYEIHLTDGSKIIINAYSYDGSGSTMLSFYIINQYGQKIVRYRFPVVNILYIETHRKQS